MASRDRDGRLPVGALAGIVLAGTLFGAVSAYAQSASEPAKTEPAKTEPAKTEPAKTEAAKPAPAKGAPAKPAPAAMTKADSASVAADAAALGARMTAAKTPAASGTGAGAPKPIAQPGRTRTSGPGVQVATAVEERTSYHYNTLGRRDPFESLVENFIGDDVGGAGPADIGGMKVVGIVWGPDPFALVEDGRGNSGILRRGDKVMNGFVESLQRDAVVVRLAIDGQSQTVSLPLVRKEENNNANR